MLYDNPRGISCSKCHGIKGEGLVIAKYKAKGKDKVLETQPIYQLDYKTFYKGVMDSKSIMPKYYLKNHTQILVLRVGMNDYLS